MIRHECGPALAIVLYTSLAFATVGRKARQVRQHVWLRRIELPAGVGQSVAATCLVVREFDAPSGVKPIEWRLGGFLGRKGDGEPGAKAIWLGLKEVHVAAKTLQKLRAGGRADNCA